MENRAWGLLASKFQKKNRELFKTPLNSAKKPKKKRLERQIRSDPEDAPDRANVEKLFMPGEIFENESGY